MGGQLRFTYGETRLVSEYLAATYPDAIVMERVRLGPVVAVGGNEGLTDAEVRMSGVFRRFADAIVVTKSELIVVEGKMRAAPDAVAQLHLYNELVDDTFDLLDYKHLPRALELVTAIADPAVERMAAKFDVRVRVYRPAWYAQWVQSRSHREATAHRDFVSETA